MADQQAENTATSISGTQNAPQVEWLLETIHNLELDNPIIRILIAGVLIAISLGLLGIVRLFIRHCLKRIKNVEKSIPALRFQRQELLSEQEVRHYGEVLCNFIRPIVTVIFGFSALTGVMILSVFTENIAVFSLNIIFGTLNYIWSGFVGYLPNLFTIVIILIVVRFVLRIIHTIFDGIAAYRIKLPNFYPEWADTSYNLLKFLIYGLTIVVIFPYLPGSSSPAFQGVSLFVGLLLSLGSTTAVANMVGGVVLTYTRAFRVGEMVKLSDTMGKVVERSLFVTRIQTLKNVVVSIPNSMVLNGHIINYSKNMGRTGLLVHTTVTIGYDVPWQKVHELLLSAADQTTNLEKEPEAFVLQTSLDDFYVTYELNAWTRKNDELPSIYSALNANILDAFRGADVEILSPHYRVNRGDMVEKSRPASK